MSDLQKRLKRLMRRKDWRVVELATYLGVPYTTVREWVVHGRQPIARSPVDRIERLLVRAER